MKWRVLYQVVKAILLSAAVVSYPKVTDCKLMEAKHVCYWYLTDDRAEKVRTLVCDCCDQHASVGATIYDRAL